MYKRQAQFLLDKVTELIEYRLSLQSKHPYSVPVAIKSTSEFKAYGIITLELLSQFSSHYVPGLFTERELIMLFRYLGLVADIGKNKYLMPSLLDVKDIPRPLQHALSFIPPLLFYFGPNGPKVGIYCFLLAHLITEAKWEFMTESHHPIQLSRNHVQFRFPGNDPGAITISDSFSTFFRVSIDFPEDVSTANALQICESACPSIYETILTGIRKASQRLNYHDSIPSVAFPCLKHQATDLHPATISRSGLLTCTTHPASVCCEMTERHQLWLRSKVSELHLNTGSH